MLSRTIALDELERVLSRYEIGPLTSPPEPGGGTANANRTLETTTGKYFLKRRNPKYADPGCVAFDHRLMAYLAAFHIGTPLPVRTRRGERWLRQNGSVYELFPYQPGDPHDRFSLAQLASAGRSLGAFHRAVRPFRATAGKAWPRYQAPAHIREGVETYRPQLKARLSPVDFAYLEAQAALLEREFPDARYHALPKLVVHGDYHPGNLKFVGDEVSGIFDLDWATVQPRVLDLADGLFLFAGERASAIDAADIVSLTQTWQPSVPRARVFILAYLQHESVTGDEWKVLEWVVRARWLNCRIRGMVKLPEERRLDYLLDGLLEPLRALDDLETLF